MAMAGYCSRGLSPLPSGTEVISLSTASIWKALATKLFSIRKKVCMVARTATTHGIMSRCLRRLVTTTTTAYVESSQLQNSSEPSCPPHQAANL